MMMTHPSLSPQPGIWGSLLGLRGRVVRICVRELSLTLHGKFHSSYIGMNVCGSTYENGCVVDVCFGSRLSAIIVNALYMCVYSTIYV